MDAKLINTLELNGDVSIPEKYIGPRGYSAYELAVKEGFEGTIDEWLESLHGDVSFSDLTDMQKESLRGPAGKDGRDGEDAIAAINPRGNWDENETYNKNDYVTYLENGNSYTCTADGTTGISPLDATIWQVIALKGAPGEPGRDGLPGLPGNTPTIGVEADTDEMYVLKIENIGQPTIVSPNLKGPRGLSAYEIALKYGFEGTEEEWLEFLLTPEDELITIKNISIMNISQIPVDNLPCCFHMVGSRIMGTYFNDDIIYISRIIDNKFSVHTMDGVIMKVFYNQEEGTLRLDDYLNLVDDVTLGDKLKDYYKKSQVDALIPDVIRRCVWFYAAGDDISLFANGNTNVASFTEFIGYKPAISNNNVGLILVDNKLYWTKFDITAINENSGAAYQEFTQDPILIGPSSGGNGELITIKNTEITNISQLPISNTAYCAHLVNCDFFYQFADDIIHIEHRPANMRVVVHTIDGAEFSLTYDGDGNFDFDNASSTSVATEKYVYEHYYDKGQIDAKIAAIELTPGPKGDPGENGSDYVITAADYEEIANVVLNNLTNADEVNF